MSAAPDQDSFMRGFHAGLAVGAAVVVLLGIGVLVGWVVWA